MVTSDEAALLMDHAQDGLINYIRQEGFSFPVLVLLKKDSDINPHDLQKIFPSVLDVRNNINCAESQTGLYSIYQTIVMLRVASLEDDNAIDDIARDIVFRYEPDAIGFIAQSIYKDMIMKERKELVRGALLTDPDTIRVIHSSFFIKGEKNDGYIKITPYLIGEATLENVVTGEDGLPCEKHTVSFSATMWQAGSKILEPRFDHPYGN